MHAVFKSLSAKLFFNKTVSVILKSTGNVGQSRYIKVFFVIPRNIDSIFRCVVKEHYYAIGSL